MVKLVAQCGQLLKGQFIRRQSRIGFLQDTRENACCAEQGKCAGKTGGFTRAWGLETAFFDIFLVSVNRILAVDVIIFELLGEAESDSREALVVLASERGCRDPTKTHQSSV